MTLTAKQLFPRSAFVGFDTMIDELDRISRNSGDTFPPHNILKTGEDQYLIELAVAGFAEDELEIEVKNRTLTIRGQIKDSDRDYIHKGISTKKFERQFRMSKGAFGKQAAKQIGQPKGNDKNLGQWPGAQ